MSWTDKLLEFIEYHIHSADDHYVRWKWAVGSVAMWDNRSVSFDECCCGVPDRGHSCTLHRVIPGTYDAPRKGIRTTVFGEKRKMSQSFHPGSWQCWEVELIVLP